MYAIVDIETTGGYAANHRITEIAIYLHDGVQITDTFHTLVNPGRSIPYYITGLTGITSEMVLSAPTFDQIAPQVFEKLDGKVFVAHNAHFDYSFLKKEFEQAGINWQARKLCTVRLSRKIIPGLRSYSLGSLAESLGIEITNRHRAKGDAGATVKIFDQLLQRDRDSHILKALKRNSGETILPPNLPKEQFDKLPAKCGVYYFHDARGNVIYVGKAINIKKRIAGHFTGDAREWSRSKIRNEIHHVTYELTGNELIALILESQEIRKLWPKYNHAQKYRVEEWGIYNYEDRNGYQRFSVNLVTRGSRPLMRFSAKGDAWNFLWEKVREFKLCPKLSGLQVSKGLCFNYQTGECQGACMCIESVKKYNKRIERAISSLSSQGSSVAIIGKGRNVDEQSLVLVEKGSYLGFGFFDSNVSISDLESARNFVRKSVETPTVQNLINSYISNPRGAEVINFG
ncbi:GIY-YIG nuclease family protein [Fulvivirgaceae bacterium PWU4]|uniref:GIY-YIG nuclease family protein n=1 Tax=Chryseosolibacter histidini TaxID=2782349 RepID=A0AAP2DPL8_9BACT|nr:exonuclease domain-containing protein [Chryseosolibacter histidini]MBT1698652.1 GIY-YIG nuclease family protein [Chryseosolibacter histidini]